MITSSWILLCNICCIWWSRYLKYLGYIRRAELLTFRRKRLRHQQGGHKLVVVTLTQGKLEFNVKTWRTTLAECFIACILDFLRNLNFLFLAQNMLKSLVRSCSATKEWYITAQAELAMPCVFPGEKCYILASSCFLSPLIL